MVSFDEVAGEHILGLWVQQPRLALQVPEAACMHARYKPTHARRGAPPLTLSTAHTTRSPGVA